MYSHNKFRLDQFYFVSLFPVSFVFCKYVSLQNLAALPKDITVSNCTKVNQQVSIFVVHSSGSYMHEVDCTVIYRLTFRFIRFNNRLDYDAY